ncbi:hypothetical protein LC1Hm_2472 [Halomicrobium sp. LC1Hm]|nr:hypothetical protein LC1Hm_2472 [Halomicrobium sp. LC1Hm]
MGGRRTPGRTLCSNIVHVIGDRRTLQAGTDGRKTDPTSAYSPQVIKAFAIGSAESPHDGETQVRGVCESER